MAIELITGLPGNAKTLFALETVITRAKAENRPVFYAGVKGLLVDDPRLEGTSWTEFEPERWHIDVPSGALILIDEAQKVFRARTLGQVPPKHVQELEEHRHRGLDFYMLTQHPGLIDPAIRKLTQVHRHMMRIFGMEASTVHRWDGEVRDTCDKPAGRKDSQKSKWGFAKRLYGLYHSADAHTMKRQIPTRLKILVGLVVVFLCLAAYIGRFLYKKTNPDAPGAVAVASESGPAAQRLATPNALQGGDQGQRLDPLQDAMDYVQRETPRVAGLPHTAPKYDELTQPSTVPVPAACIQVGSSAGKMAPKCKCYTQKGTPMAVEYNMCIEIAHNGYFLDFDPNGRENRREQADRAQHSAQLVPDRGNVSGAAQHAQVASFSEVPEERKQYRLAGAPSS